MCFPEEKAEVQRSETEASGSILGREKQPVRLGHGEQRGWPWQGGCEGQAAGGPADMVRSMAFLKSSPKQGRSERWGWGWHDEIHNSRAILTVGLL